MIRVIILGGFLVGLSIILNLREFKSFTVLQSRFVYEEAEKMFKEHLEEIALLEEKRFEMLNPKIVEEIVEDTTPLVLLDSPELQRGHDLYLKCIVCHRKSGAGKKSQNAPAIGGQYNWYIEEQVVNMQQGRRINKTMFPFIKNLSIQDIKDLALYVSHLPWMKK